ncbi:MAG TPA: histidine kinase [Mycobacteriales bacterium]|nr:histidine kinase [Mycobacteriales bacterium]
MEEQPHVPVPVLRGLGGHLPGWARPIARQAVTVITAVQTFSGLGGLTASQRVLAVVLELLVAASWTVIVVRRCGDWLNVAMLAASIGLAGWLHVLTGNGQVYVLGYAALFVGPVFYTAWQAIVPAACGVLAVGLSTALVGQRDIPGGFGNAVGAAFFGLAAMFFGQVLRSAQRNAELVAELRESRDAQQRNAVISERARLARELHDVLAHTLSSLSLHLESTRVLADARGVDIEVRSRIERAVALARDGLEEARDAVGTLRDDALPGPERIRDLVTDFERSTGVVSRFEEVGSAAPLSPEASVALFRAAQEALTNAGKHGHSTRVDVRLEWDGDRVTLRVIDDGGGGDGVPALPGGGNGLRGMRERAELAGGRMDAGPTSRGFAVEVRLPVAVARPREVPA